MHRRRRYAHPGERAIRGAPERAGLRQVRGAQHPPAPRQVVGAARRAAAELLDLVEARLEALGRLLPPRGVGPEGRPGRVGREPGQLAVLAAQRLAGGAHAGERGLELLERRGHVARPGAVEHLRHPVVEVVDDLLGGLELLALQVDLDPVIGRLAHGPQLADHGLEDVHRRRPREVVHRGARRRALLRQRAGRGVELVGIRAGLLGALRPRGELAGGLVRRLELGQRRAILLGVRQGRRGRRQRRRAGEHKRSRSK